MLILLMLSVTCKHYMLSVVMLSVIMLSVIILSVIMLSVIMLNVIMLSVVMLTVVMLSVAAPRLQIRNVFMTQHMICFFFNQVATFLDLFRSLIT